MTSNLPDFSSQCPHLAASYGGHPCGGGWALRTGIGMTINLPGHPIYVSGTVLFSYE